ncbi:tetratricopeptide repeat protein [Massilia sp. TWP1-3-3]|uniref:tetratricopeptide repeat protein n=1 Tax=Massilia sp. TWP1-3-3 TaxID=2804573 RepID=UPI003CEC5E50
MSLINKMLQDLDARGSHSGVSLPSEVRAAGPARRQLPLVRIAVVASVVVIAVALAVVFWLRRPGAATVTAPAVVVLVPKVIAPAPAPAPAAPVVPAAAAVAAVTPAPPLATPTKALEPTRKVVATAVPAVVAPAQGTVRDTSDSSLAVEAAPVRVVAAPRIKPAPIARLEVPQRGARVVRMAEPLPLPVAGSPIGGRDMTSAQRSEAQYRIALAALEEGRMAGAFAALDHALKLNPRHDAARQSLVALLIEAGRNDEAMQQLEQGLAVDAAQPTMAMLLARMQIERGTSGVATLMRTLPAASGNGDYHAFLAGALQRESRHREAAEQYGAALRTMPEHGVWLMGLGISLQAEKRDRDALAAFQRAKASGTLTPPLQAFVERKIVQLTP